MRTRFIPDTPLFLGSQFGNGNDYRHPVLDGELYQPTADATELASRREFAASVIVAQTTLPVTFDLFQDWVELDWKVPHGSFQAVERFGDKLLHEEILLEAAPVLDEHYPDLCNPPQLPLPSTPNLIDELGDILWLTAALASNSWASVDRGVRALLHHKDLVPRQGHTLSILDVDYQLSIGFNPTATVADSFFADDEFEDYNPGVHLGAHAASLRARAEKQYGYNERGFYDTGMQHDAQMVIEPLIGQLVLAVGYYAQRFAGSTLAGVVLQNMQKVTQRVQTHTIDKADGPRVPKTSPNRLNKV